MHLRPAQNRRKELNIAQRSIGLGIAPMTRCFEVSKELTYSRNDDMDTSWWSHKVLCGMWIHDKGAAILG